MEGPNSKNMEKLNRIINNRNFKLLFLGYIFICLIVIAFAKPIFCDAQDHAAQGYAILNGQWPGIDYMPHSAFLTQYLYYGLFAIIFHMNLFVMRFFSAGLIFLLIIFLWATMSRLRYQPLTCVLAVLSLIVPAYFSMFYIEFIHYNLTIAFLGYAFLSVFYFLRPGLTEKKMVWVVFFIGLLYGISAATRMHIFVMTPVFMGIVLYRYVSITGSAPKKSQLFEAFFVLILGILAVNIPNILILARCYSKIIYSYVEFLPLLFWGWKVYFENNASILLIDLRELFVFLRDPGNFFIFSLFLSALYLSILKLIRSLKEKAKFGEKVFFPASCAFFSVVLLAIYWYFGMFRYYYSHLLFIWACASIMVFDYLIESKKVWHVFALRFIVICALLGAAAFGARAAVYALRYKDSDSTIGAYYEAAKLIKKYTKPDDVVLAATAMPVVLSGRKPYHNNGFPRSAFYWHCLKADTPAKAITVYPKTIFSKAVFLDDIEKGNISYMLMDVQLRDIGYTFDLPSVIKKFKLLDKANGFELYIKQE